MTSVNIYVPEIISLLSEVDGSATWIGFAGGHRRHRRISLWMNYARVPWYHNVHVIPIVNNVKRFIMLVEIKPNR